MTPALPDLIARVDALTGPDREVDKIIYTEIEGYCAHPYEKLHATGAQSDTGFDCECGADSWGNTGPKGEKLNSKIPTFTGPGLDAALALVPKGYYLGINYSPDDNEWGALLQNDIISECHTHPTGPALALLGAILRAKLAEQKP